jgi:hypothetical protein
MDREYGIHKTEDRRREIFLTASLINKFNEGCPLSEIYEKGIDCYEILLDLIEKPEVAKEISGLIKQPQEEIKLAAVKIVNLFLFNKDNNPFLSLGLSDSAPGEEIKKRWKRLLILYHPDRMSNRKGYEEVAKRINQAHEEIEELRGKSHGEKMAEKSKEYIPVKAEFSNTSTTQMLNFKYLKFLPTFIIIAVVSIAIFTIILLFIKL